MMKSAFTLVFVVIAFSCFAQKKKLIPVAFYNVENLFDTADDPKKDDDEFTPAGAMHYTNAVYQQKLSNIAKVLSQLGIDSSADGAVLIGLAEIENKRVLADLVAQASIAKRTYKYLHYDSPDPRGIDVALLYQPAYFKVVRLYPIPVKVKDGDHRESVRDILYVEGVLLKDTVHILVNHWPSRREGKDETEAKRKEVAMANAAQVRKLVSADPNARIIVMGDFNDDPVDESIVAMGARAEKSSIGKYELYNPWVNIFRAGSGTLAYNDQWNLFDQVMFSRAFISNKKGLQFVDGQIFNADFLQQQKGRYKGYPHRSFSRNKWLNGYSDHFPVLVYLRYP